MPAQSSSGPIPRGLAQRICTHNPFYLISAGLVIYGLHLTLNGRGARDEGLLVMSVLGGYTLLLAASGWLIVHFGQVWDDARTILLTVALLFIALATSFDKIALDDPLIGGAFLAISFVFCVAVTEAILAALRIRLAARYRAPFYLQLALLFAYPAWLAHLSVSDQEPLMAWYVLLFPALAALALLTLWPAAHWGQRQEPRNGTPWRWPLFPWSLFVLLGVGIAGRAYGLAMAFELAPGLTVGFRGYFLTPLLVAALVLLLELGLTAGSRRTQQVALALALPLLLLAFPGPAANLAQANFYAMITNSFGGPALWTILGVALFYAWAWFRGVRLAEAGVLVCLLLMAVVRPETFSWRTLGAPQQPLVIGVATWLTVLGVWRRASLRVVLAVWLLLADGALLSNNNLLGVNNFLIAAHIAVLATLLIGLAFNDALAQRIRKGAPGVLALFAIAAAALYIPSLASFTLGLRIAELVALVIVAATYVIVLRRRTDLAALGICGTALVGLSANWLYVYLEQTAGLKGLAWLAWGLGCLAVGVLISLFKGGLLGQLRRLLHPAPPPAY